MKSGGHEIVKVPLRSGSGCFVALSIRIVVGTAHLYYNFKGNMWPLMARTT